MEDNRTLDSVYAEWKNEVYTKQKGRVTRDVVGVPEYLTLRNLMASGGSISEELRAEMVADFENEDFQRTLDIQELLLSDKNTPSEVIREIAHSYILVPKVLKHPNCPEDLFWETLEGDTYNFARYLAKKHPGQEKAGDSRGENACE